MCVCVVHVCVRVHVPCAVLYMCTCVCVLLRVYCVRVYVACVCVSASYAQRLGQTILLYNLEIVPIPNFVQNMHIHVKETKLLLHTEHTTAAGSLYCLEITISCTCRHSANVTRPLHVVLFSPLTHMHMCTHTHIHTHAQIKVTFTYTHSTLTCN